MFEFVNARIMLAPKYLLPLESYEQKAYDIDQQTNYRKPLLTHCRSRRRFEVIVA
jgi:hypothetical protein